ncbi:hypothetical protein [Ensifer sp. NM-2]|uniref:hypothetical protein n=1 Tax=Ensifer sp. NM-2 TaxID=2109730 RepID=UPI0011B1D61F|nr:hypothetical protein [Ensifer sp. NM-2]
MVKQAKAAAAVKIVKKLVREHPFIAADLVVAGLSRAARVGIEEAWESVKPGGPDGRKIA